MGITIKDIARMADTSIATVSNVLSNKSGVGDAKRKLVLELVEKTGYRPHRSARSLVLRKSGAIGFIVSDLFNTVYVDIFRGVETAFCEKGFQVLLTDSQMDLAKEKLNVELMLDNRVEGLAIIPVSEFMTRADVSHFASLKNGGTPFVVGGKLRDLDVDSVTSEEVNAAYDLTNYLLDLGHRRIAFVGYDSTNRAAIERYEGTRKAMERTPDGDFLCYECHANAPIHIWSEKVDFLLTLPDRPTAVIMVNDIVGINAIQRCKALGLAVPEDVSIVSFGNQPATNVIDPPMTTFAEDIQQISAAIVEALTRRMENPKLPALHRLVPQNLIVRRSTGPCPKRVRKAR